MLVDTILIFFGGIPIRNHDVENFTDEQQAEIDKQVYQRIMYAICLFCAASWKATKWVEIRMMTAGIVPKDAGTRA